MWIRDGAGREIRRRIRSADASRARAADGGFVVDFPDSVLISGCIYLVPGGSNGACLPSKVRARLEYLSTVGGGSDCGAHQHRAGAVHERFAQFPPLGPGAQVADAASGAPRASAAPSAAAVNNLFPFLMSSSPGH